MFAMVFQFRARNMYLNVMMKILLWKLFFCESWGGGEGGRDERR